MASIQGWGRETWSSGAWNEQAPVSVTGNGLTSSLGTETVATDQNISVTGVGLTSAASMENDKSRTSTLACDFLISGCCFFCQAGPARDNKSSVPAKHMTQGSSFRLCCDGLVARNSSK